MNNRNMSIVSADILPIGIYWQISWRRLKYHFDPFRYLHLRSEAVLGAINAILVLKKRKGFTGYLSREDLSSDHCCDHYVVMYVTP